MGKAHFWKLFIVTSLLTLGTFLFETHTNFIRTSILNIPPHKPFNGTTAPIQFVPDWIHASEEERNLTFDEFPSEKLIPLPEYDLATLSRREKPFAWGNPEDNAIRNQEITYGVVWAGSYRLDGKEKSGSHPAVDIKALRGTPVFVMANGIVEKVSTIENGFGYHVVVAHYGVPTLEDESKTTTLYSAYAHLRSIDVKVGQVITKGQKIGEVGDTGTATTYHLHFQVDKNDAPWHPYWPFTGSEARASGLSFYEAVNAGLGLANVETYTISPMPYVRKYQNYEKQASQTLLQQQNNSLTTNVTFSETLGNEKADVINDQSAKPSFTQSAPTQDVVADALITSTTAAENTPLSNVASFEVAVLDSFTLVGESARIILTARDVQGNKVLKPVFPKTVPYLELITPIGSLSDEVIEDSDFINGEAHIVLKPSFEGETKVKVNFQGNIVVSDTITAVQTVRQSYAYRIEHDGWFIPEQAEEIRIVALDEANLPTPKVYFGGKLEISVPNSDGASFSPRTDFVPEDFVNGTLQVEFTPQKADEYYILLSLNGGRIFESEPFISELTRGLVFLDVRLNHPQYKAINALHERGIIAGYKDGTFKPDRFVSRVESLKFIYKIGKDPLQEKQDLRFSDVQAKQWYSSYVATALENGVIDGYPDNTFKPERGVIKAEFLKMLFKALRIDIPPPITPFMCQDVKLEDWFSPFIEFAARNGIFATDAQGNCNPGEKLSRGNVAEIIFRMSEKM